MDNIEVEYYQKGEKIPVYEFIQDRTEKEKAKIMYYLKLLKEKGPVLHEPYVKKVSGKVYELRPGFAGSEFRIFFFLAWQHGSAASRDSKERPKTEAA